MYILQNAGKNIVRNKGRNILMGIIILFIIAASAVALIINNTAGGIIDNYRERFDSEVSIVVNHQKMQEEAMKNMQSPGGGGGGPGTFRMMLPQIPPEQYIRFGDSDYISKAHYTSSVGVFKGDDLKPIDEDKGGGGGMARGIHSMDGTNTVSDDGQYYANLYGYNFDTFTPEEFANGNRKLAEGNFPQNDGECILSRDLLENSGLKIGDKITLGSKLRDAEAIPEPGSEDEIGSIDISYALTIVGYYDDMTNEYPNDFIQNAYMNRRNEIITTINTVISQLRDGYSGIRVEAKYYLKNPDMLDKFAAELYANGLDEKFDVTTDKAGYEAIVKPVEGLKTVVFWFLVVVLALGAVILILLSTIAIRERKYEIGVLRAMGMKKFKVAFGLLSEVIIITLVCLILGLGTGIAAAQPVSDGLLKYQLEQIESKSDDNPTGYAPINIGGGSRGATFGGMRVIGGPGMESPAEALKEMDVSMSGFTLLLIIFVSLGLALCASSMSVIHVTRYEPIKILSDRT